MSLERRIEDLESRGPTDSRPRIWTPDADTYAAYLAGVVQPPDGTVVTLPPKEPRP